MAKVKKKRPRSTNLKVRAYAQERGIRLYDIAEYLGITATVFSQSWMSRELLEQDQSYLMSIIDDMKERGYGKA